MIRPARGFQPVAVAVMPEERPAPKGDQAVIRLPDNLPPEMRRHLVREVVMWACRIRETRPPEAFVGEDHVLRVELPRGWRKGRGHRAQLLRLALARLCGAAGYKQVDDVIVEKEPWRRPVAVIKG